MRTTVLIREQQEVGMGRSIRRSLAGLAAAVVAGVLVTAFPGTAHATLTPVPGQFYEVLSRHSGGCLEVDYGRSNPGADVTEDWCYGPFVDYQLWQFHEVFRDPSGVWFQIVVKHTNMCLEVAWAGMWDGANVIQNVCAAATNQHWKIADTSDGYGYIIARHSGKCLDLAGGDWDVIQWNCWGGNNQQWKLR
jgi:hypothetical protein